MSLRLLLANNVYPPQAVGGAEIVMRRQARQLRRRGHHVAILAGWLPGLAGEDQEMERDGDAAVYRFPFRSWDPMADVWPANSDAFFDAVLDEENPDIVHCHNLRGIGVGLIGAARRRQLPVFVTLHDYWWHCHWATRIRPSGQVCDDVRACGTACGDAARQGGMDLPLRFRRDSLLRCLDRAQKLIAPSRALALSYGEAGIGLDEIFTLSSGVNIDDIAAPARAPRAMREEPLQFVSIGSLAPHKGIEDLLAAAQMLNLDPATRGRWKLAIAGDGALRDGIERDISTDRFGKSVSLLGKLPHDDVLRLLAQADVVVLASRWPENESVVLLEGMAAGAAVIATRIGGNDELVRNSQGGLLAPPSDPVGLACAMAAYIRQPSLAAEHAAWNRARRPQLCEVRAIDELERLYVASRTAEVATEAAVPVVICSGHLSSGARSLFDRFHEIEPASSRRRLLWHAWADAEDWRSASFLIDLGGDRAGRERALLEGLPIAEFTAPDTGGHDLDFLVQVAAALLVSASPSRDVSSRSSRLRRFWRDAGPAPAPRPAMNDDFYEAVGKTANNLKLRHPGFCDALQA